MRLEGTITALVTPFNTSGVDFEGLRENIALQLHGGVDGILVLGTTGEAPTLSSAEKAQVITTAVEAAGGAVPVLVGTGTNNTATTIEATCQAATLGADAAVIITPYYNRPTQNGIIKHFEAICNATTLPVCLYNHGPRTGTQLSVSTIAHLAALPNVIALKEAASTLDLTQEVVAQIVPANPNFTILSGNDDLTLPRIALGASGVISIASNLVPEAMARLVNAARNGNLAVATKMHYQLRPLLKALEIETNPIPIKAAMNQWGLPAGVLRLPLCAMERKNLVVLQDILADSTSFRPMALT